MSTERPASGADRGIIRLLSTDLNILVPLLVLLEERSVTKAAARVGLSQPAMSHLLKRARTAAQDELMVWQRSSFALTPRGRALLKPLRELLEDATRVLDLSSFNPMTDRRTVTLAATTTTAYVVVPGLMARLESAAPNMSLVVRIAHGIADDYFEADDQLDLVLLADGVASQHPRVRLYEDHWVAVVAADNDRLRDGLDLDTIATSPHVIFDGGPLRTSPYVALDTLGLQVNVRCRVADFLLIPHLIAGTTSIAFVQDRVARRLAKAMPIRVHQLPFPVPALGLDVIWNPRIGNDPMRAWFDEQLRHSLPSHSFAA